LNRTKISWWVSLVLAGVILRLLFVSHIAFTNDEGAYLLDAKLLWAGQLPGGDVLTKAPAVIVPFSLAAGLSHYSLWAARAVSLLANLAATLPLAVIAYYWGGKAAAHAVAFLWLLVPGPALFLTLGQTESLAAFYSAAALACWLAGFYTSRPHRQILFLVLAGVCFGLALASRKTALFVLLPALFWGWSYRRRFPGLRRPLALAGLGLTAVLAGWGLLVSYVYGIAGIQQALGAGYGTVIAKHLSMPEGITSWGADGWTVFGVVVRVVAPFVLLVLFALLGKLREGWAPGLIIALLAAWRLSDSTVFSTRFVSWSWWLVALLFMWEAISQRRKLAERYSEEWGIVLWLVALAGVYALWPTFLVDYIGDFFLPAVLWVGLVLVRQWPAILLPRRLVWGSVFILSLISSLGSAWRMPWTGMFTPAAIHESAAALRQHVPREDPVLTAAVIVPYVSGHSVYRNIAHPLWYRFEFIETAERDRFLPAREVIDEEIQNGIVKWVVTEHLTDYAYFHPAAGLASILRERGEKVETIPNETGFRSNPLTLWRLPF
jgi:4-amino-4-deoxy-L-arabinose transferase-like glycosyltransferase